MTTIVAWVLVVIVGTGETGYQVWPGATIELLSRRSQSFASKSQCEDTKRRAEVRWAQKLAQYPLGKYPYEPVAAMTCVAVTKTPPTRKLP